jgi:RNA polymerase sigma-70 factor (ECF subfamily)
MTMGAPAPANVVPLRPLDGRTDDELMLLARAGRREAFDVLVLRHQGPALKVAARYLGDAAAAKDACQNAFVEVYRGAGRYQPRDRFVFYLRRVVLNQCRMSARRLRIAERLPADEEELASQPDEVLLANERRKVIDQSLLRLSDKLREVVSLRFAGGHSLEEIAQILEVPLGTVKSRLFSAMAQLKDVLGGPA